MSKGRVMDNLLESLKSGSTRNHAPSARRALGRKSLPAVPLADTKNNLAEAARLSSATSLMDIKSFIETDDFHF